MAENREALHQVLTDYFAVDELETLCFLLKVDYENLVGEGKAGKARELILFMEHRGRIEELVAEVKRQRPNVAQAIEMEDRFVASIKPIQEQERDMAQSTAQARHGVVVDLSHHQDDWDRFTKFIQNAPFAVIEKSLLECTQDINRAAALIIALPRRSLFTPEESKYLANWVEKGGGLFLLGNYAPIHHETKPNELANRFGLHFDDNLIMPEGKLEDYYCRVQGRSFKADLAIKITPLETDAHPILQGITDIAFLSSCSVRITFDPDGHAQTLLKSPATSGTMIPLGKIDEPYGFMPMIDDWILERCTEAPVLVATQYGKGKVVASGSYKICALEYGDNARLVKNIMAWITE